jgi:putative membrane-bound dehydrogenase-like protein
MTANFLLALPLVLSANAVVEVPAVLDDRLELQLVAAEPDVRTPVGIAVDSQGRVLVIESHTHFRPKDYAGPEHDRILMLEDFDPASGKARKIGVFFEGTTHTMNLAVHHDGSVYVATRSEIFRLRDTGGDGCADERTRICHLDTPGNYPHNGLSGFAFDFAGNVYFGFGENLGAEYKLIGSDERTLEGGGEGGNIYCCDPDGKNLRRVATGFWNPFHLCFDAFGRLFAVDNDPDSRPPCRLLHIVEGGDYGYRFRHGRKGVHPFTAWNGELPGTLPMVAGTGEAPSGILAYESDNLPEEYRGDLLVTSWGDHRIERYRLRPRGASFSAEMTPVVRGGENFRPVGIALAPDGSLYISDWVDKSYQLHGQGRIWRLSAKQPPEPRAKPASDLEAIASVHGPTREAAVYRLRRAGIANDHAVKAFLDAREERTQAVAIRLLANNVSHSKALMVGLLGTHPSPNVHFAVAQQLADVPVYLYRAPGPGVHLDYGGNRTRLEAAERAGGWSAAAAAVLIADSRTRPYALRQIDHYWLMQIDDSGRRRIGTVPGYDHRETDQLWAAAAVDPFLLHAASLSVQRELEKARSMRRTGDEFARMDSRLNTERLAMALAAWRSGVVKPRELVPELLADREPQLQLVGLLWLAEAEPQDVTDMRWRVENVLKRPNLTRQVFEVAVATFAHLDGVGKTGKDEAGGEAYLLRVLTDDSFAPPLKQLALRAIPPDHPSLSRERLSELIEHGDDKVRLEVIRTVRLRADAAEWKGLRQIAGDEAAAAAERCEAIMGLIPQRDVDRKLLVQLASSDSRPVADEALRALRGADLADDERRQVAELAAKLDGPRKELAERVLQPEPPSDLPQPQNHAAWMERAKGEGDPEAGERIFFHPRVAGCYRCHEYEGRGHTVGPDLTTIGRTMPRQRLIESIVDPSREIAPQFTSWLIRTTDGEVKTGLHVGDELDGRIRFADSQGQVFYVHPNDIDERQPSRQSIMPEGLADQLTAQELRDLLAFLLRQP